MSMISFGDAATFLQQMRTTTSLKTDLNRLSGELSTGVSADLPERLGSQSSEFMLIRNEIEIIDTFARTSASLGNRLEQMQTRMEMVETLRVEVMSTAIGTGGSGDALPVARAAVGAFSSIVAQFNGTYGGDSLFAGTAVDGPALASGEDMLDDIVLSIGGATDETTILDAIDDWFDLPTGGFATMGYLGDTGNLMTRQIGPGQQVTIPARADDDGVKAVLKGIAIAAVVDKLSLSLSDQTQASLVEASGNALLSAASPFTQMRGAVGVVENEIALTLVSQDTQRTTLAMANNDMSLVDPYETASALQDVQAQLETQFIMTARISQLSLVNFL